MSSKSGAYILYIEAEVSLTLEVGSLGTKRLPAGHYAYVGSALRGTGIRVSRHRRLADQKSGKLHWHIDYLLVHPHARWIGEVILEDGIECNLSQRIASMDGVTVPVPGFGSSDCRKGCKAHLYLLPSENQIDPALLLARRLYRKSKG